MTYFTIDDLAPCTTKSPRKGDTVRATVEGEYSHKGDPALASGFHIVKVGKRDVALPPDTAFEVVERWQPPEPPVGSVVQNAITGDWWQHRDALYGHYWICINRPKYDTYLWYGLLGESDNGRQLHIYHPAQAVT